MTAAATQSVSLPQRKRGGSASSTPRRNGLKVPAGRSSVSRAVQRKNPNKTAAPDSGKSGVRRKHRAGRPAARPLPAKSSSGSNPVRFGPGLRGTLSVIISARNEASTLPALLKQVELLNPAEIIVVLNGCTDNSFQCARMCSRAIIMHCPQSAGHDVGRAMGAKVSRGDILLFLDGDMAIPAGKLAAFAAAVDKGVDVALNDLDNLLPPFGASDDVSRYKMYLNMVLGRSDLGASSMTAVPHALSRQALSAIGCRELMVPPKAQAISILKGLRVEKAASVNVIKHNRLRKENTGAGNAVAQLIAGDHAEALGAYFAEREISGFVTGEQLLRQRAQMADWRNGL
ncbi:glycosyltransferase [Paenibacillus sp. PK3_47]|uniref:glycosyltransferase family 2 protein n=1 Tax=Paenibacillus sp. PK3_47 TaxID=2072642 RepID=UPI00201E7342|nr:glycosyltransferase [Paenibacillus sp. PK3_47]UQZ33247.1 glycosyltransferase [Paenibacillus sp. PK3_47]